MAERVSTPLLRQYREIKSHHEDAILFFRMGDFYEMFFDDATLGAKVLGITLTSRGDGVPLAGVPVKAATEYLRQLVAAGHRVAICEQVEDPKQAKGIVRREVVETVTPGAVLEEDWVAGGRNNFLVAISPAGTRIGLAAIDLSTGEFLLETSSPEGVAEALGRFGPSELVLPPDGDVPYPAEVMRTRREAWEFDLDLAREELPKRFGLAGLDGLGIQTDDAPAVRAAGALLRYISDLQPGGLPQLRPPSVRRSEGYLWIDEMTRRNLELVEPLRAGAQGVTLLEILDRTSTPMGARLLRQWVLSPLSEEGAIGRRLDAVERSLGASGAREDARTILHRVRDVERLAARAAAGRATPRDLGALRDSFQCLPTIAEILDHLASPDRTGPFATLADDLDPLTDLTTRLTSALHEHPPVALADGNVIREGFDPQLDELRSLRDGGKQYLASLQERERVRTGIPSLKVGYNRVFGYFIEITHTHRSRIPDDYERRQTLTSSERYVTPELKEHEAKILGAEESLQAREAELFTSLRDEVGQAISRIQRTAVVVANLDVWVSLADVAESHGYVRPTVDVGFTIELVASRHPVLERLMPRERFIPNDVCFTPTERVQLVTGPNMAGKSTILRQIGLTVVMAQMGSFVPATKARMGVVDRLFTRVGASDNLAQGQSTFMVEMSETSAILHGATARSLVLLDEIGRGTSTYDGVAIAWAVTEYLHDRVGCKTMFATHYHELMQLPERLEHARNLNVAVQETADTVVFLHRLEPGGTDRSYGVHVAQLAGLPRSVVSRATEVLHQLEGEHRVVAGTPVIPDASQFGLFAGSAPEPLAEELRDLDVDSLTPLEALNRLAALKQRAKES